MSNFIHGDNLYNKFKVEKGQENLRLLAEISSKYEEWKEKNMEIEGTTESDIQQKVILLNEYKSFINQPKFKKEAGNKYGFTSQSQLHSTVIEEFMYYLFKDIIKLKDKNMYWGRTKAYTNLYFSPENIDSFEENSNIVINVKNQDFSISKEVVLKSRVTNNENWQENNIYVPIVSIECKTYLDNKIYENLFSKAEIFKRYNPCCLFLIVTEIYKVDLDIEPKLSDINQIYVLRKGSINNQIYEDIVWDLFKYVVGFIFFNKEEHKNKILKYGKVIL